MDLHYRTATISLCLDLTAPEAQTVPIAIFLAGETPAGKVAALLAITNHPVMATLDPWSRGIVAALPNVLQNQVRDTFRLHADRTIADLVEAMSDCFRNTLFMYNVSAQQTIALAPDASELSALNVAISKVLNHAFFNVAAPVLLEPMTFPMQARDVDAIEPDVFNPDLELRTWPGMRARSHGDAQAVAK